MAKNGGRDFKKGQSGNPNGRPKLPDYQKEANKLNKTKFQGILQKYIHCNLAELKEYLAGSQDKKSKTSALDLVIIKVLVEAIKKGDEKRLGFILDRLIGKVKEEVKIETDSYTGLIDLIALRKKEIDD